MGSTRNPIAIFATDVRALLNRYKRIGVIRADGTVDGKKLQRALRVPRRRDTQKTGNLRRLKTVRRKKTVPSMRSYEQLCT